jgi:RecB family endonuclease NucS
MRKRPMFRRGDELKLERRPYVPPGHRRFKHEREMVAYVIDHLEEIEEGLELYSDWRPGTEYPCVVRTRKRSKRMDILAQDKEGGLVVIECKKWTGLPEALGQLLGYMGWVQEHMCLHGERVRGVLVAGHVSPMLLYAVRLLGSAPSVAAVECRAPGEIRRLWP